MESEIVNIGVNAVIIEIDKYQTGSGGIPTIEYKDGDSAANCESDTWHTYVTSFESTGFVKIKVSN